MAAFARGRMVWKADTTCGPPSHWPDTAPTISCQTLDEINRELLDQQTWSGGLVHYRSDGYPIMTANSWHLHRKFNSEARFVTEVHADIVSTGSVVEAHLMIDLPEQATSKMRPGRTPSPSPSAQRDTPRTARASAALAVLLAHARRRTRE